MKKQIWILSTILFTATNIAVSFAQDGDDEDKSEVVTPPSMHVSAPEPSAEATSAASPAATSPSSSKPSTPPKKPADAASSAAASNGTAVSVPVGFFLRNISKYDAMVGKYTAEFELTLQLPANAPSAASDFDILNGRIVKKEEQKTDEPNTKEFKVEAEIDLDLDFKRFPWDEQDLSITIYNPELDSKALKYQVESTKADETNIDEKVKLVGWNLEENEPTVTEDSSSNPNEKFSTYTFGINIARMRYAATMKVLFPLTIMLLISFLALAVGASAAVNRFTILTGTLLAAVMFHLNASSVLPPIGYLTMADKVFFCCYLSFLINLIFTVFLLKLNEFKLEAKVKSTYKLALWVVPVVSFAGIGLALLGVL